MNYREIKPDGFLKHFVKFFYFYENKNEDIEHTILPDACFDLLADYEDGVLQDVILTGIWNKPITITVTKGTTLLSIRFKLLASEYLLDNEIKSNLNTMCSLPLSFWGLDTFKHDEFDTFAERLTNKLLESLSKKKIDTRKLNLFEIIYQDQFQNVQSLSEFVDWSSRQINRYFDKQLGVSAKALLRMVRCNSSYANIANGDLYPENKHFDQSHFIKEVKKYTWQTPRDLAKNENDQFLQLSVVKGK